MSEALTSDGKYWFIEQGDGNVVVYKKDPITGEVVGAVWDKWSYEAANDQSPEQPEEPEEPELPPISIVTEDSIPLIVKANVNPIGMSYWRVINQHSGSSELDLLLSINDELTVFTIDKKSLLVLNERKLGISHTGEGCFYSAHNRYDLFIPFDRYLMRLNTSTMEREEVWYAEEGTYLWQMHADYSETVFSASIKDLNYNIIKWGVFRNGQVKYYELKGDPDECQIDKSSDWLLVKEDNYNRIINLKTDQEIIIPNEGGALGHSDNGFSCALGENDMSNLGGALDLIDFTNLGHRNVFHTDVWNMGYVSYTNAKPGPRGKQVCLLSSSDNRLIAVKLDGTDARLVCDLLTQNQDYENRPKATLCPNGEFATWTAFVNGQRNAYIVRIPSF